MRNGIEAREGRDVKQARSRSDESPVGEADAPNSLRNNPPNPPCNTDLTDVERDWLIRQLEAWPTRVDPEKTTNIEYLMKKAAALLVSNRSGVGLLDWLAEHSELELSCRPVEGDLSEEEWQVYRVNGGYNDREWNLVGSGLTPLAALQQARAALDTEKEK